MSVKTFLIAIAMTASAASACLRATADRRAVQWSDAIVHGKLRNIDDPAKQVYTFDVTDTIDGPLKPGQQTIVQHVTPPGAGVACGGHLTGDDVGKSFLLLLRARGKDLYVIVNIAAADSFDSTGIDAFKQLVQETRKADASLTNDQMKVQALAYADAQDDTEADQAEEALRQMGPKAVPMMQQAMGEVGDIGKQRLEPLIRDLIPPGEAAPTTRP